MKTRRIFFYILLTIVSIAFLYAGGVKAFGVKKAIDVNSTLHIETWFIRLIGFLEVLGAVGLWLTRFRTAAAICLAIIMVGAIGCHVGADQLGHIGPATALFFLLAALITLDPQNKLVLQTL